MHWQVFGKRSGADLARVYEVPSPEHDFVQSLIQREIEQFPELDDGKRKYFFARQPRRTERQQQEWALADVVIANSTFTRDSYAAAGLDVSKVRIVPLGAPPICKAGLERGSRIASRYACSGSGLSVFARERIICCRRGEDRPVKKAILHIFGANIAAQAHERSRFID